MIIKMIVMVNHFSDDCYGSDYDNWCMVQIKGFCLAFCFGKSQCFHINSYFKLFCWQLNYWPTNLKFALLFIICRP